MQVTDVRIRRIHSEGKMKALASVTFDNEFVVHELRVIEGEHGLFVAMPSRRTGAGEYRDIAHPIDSRMRGHIQEVVIGKYREALVGDGSARTA